MIFPFLFTMGLCALTHAASANEMRMDDVIPEEGSVHVLHLPNGVKTYIQENEVPPQCASFRVVFRKPSCEEVMYTYDGRLDSVDIVEQFFIFCKERASANFKGSTRALEGCNYSCSDLPTMRMDCAQEIAVIAVGDFVYEDMKRLVEKNFGDIEFGLREYSSDCSSSIQIDFDEGISKVALRVSFPNIRQSIYTYQDLNESWKYLILQELLQQRMERCSRGLDETWVHPHPRFFYPVNGYSFSSEGNSENLLSFLLWQVEAIRNDGFYEDEFYVTKRKLINQLQYLSSSASRPDDAFLASYYADQFLLGDRCLDYRDFLSASAQLVQDMQSTDLQSSLSSFLLDKNRQIQVVYPMEMHAELLTKDRIEQLIQKVASLAAFYRNSEKQSDMVWMLKAEELRPLPPVRKESLIQEPVLIQLVNDEEPAEFRLADNAVAPAAQNPGSPTEAFYQLPLNEKEKRFIKIIISTMAEKNIVQLALEKRSLEKKGKKINHVHPMRFLGYILSNSELRNHLRTIKKSSFKWDAFVDGFAKRMREEHHNNNLYPHVAGFAQQAGATQEHVNHYIDKKDYEGLIKSFL